MKMFLIILCLMSLCSDAFTQEDDGFIDPERASGAWEGYAAPQKSQHTGALPSKKEEGDGVLFDGGFSDNNMPVDQEGISRSDTWGFAGPEEDVKSSKGDKGK